MCDKMSCEHENFTADVVVARMPSKEGGPIERYSADVRIKCDQCGLPFRFIGLPCGIDLNGAAVSIDGTEARLAIAPKGQVVTPMEDTECRGFTIRKTN